MDVRKKIVTDENHQPVAVQIDYDDWLRIAHALDLETLDEEGASDTSAASADQDNADQNDNLGVLLDASKGIWQGGDGLEYQRRIRAEWTRPWDPEAQEDETETT